VSYAVYIKSNVNNVDIQLNDIKKSGLAVDYSIIYNIFNYVNFFF